MTRNMQWAAPLSQSNGIMSLQFNPVHALCRESFDFFVQQAVPYLNPGGRYQDAPYIGAMSECLMRLRRGDFTKVAMTVPPRHLKSTLVSVAYVAWMLGHDPTLRFVVASYGEELATKLARDFRKILEWDFFQAIFPNCQIHPRRNNATEIQTTRGGGRRAVSLDGPLTGMGADYIIIDDLLKAKDGTLSATERKRAKDYYEQTLYSRLDNKATGRIIVVQQRLHQDDFIGYIIQKEGFVHLSFPAIARKDEEFSLPRGRLYSRRIGDVLNPARESREELERTRNQVTSAVFEAQWQQDPSTSGADLLRVEHFQRYDNQVAEEEVVYVVQSWDTAIKAGPENDCSVCVTAGYHPGVNAWLLLNVTRVRLEYSDLQSLARALANKYRADRILIEDSGIGRALTRHLRSTIGPIAFALAVRDGKEERLAAGSPHVRENRVLAPREADWLDDFFAELRMFPNGKHDDQVDAFSQFLHWLSFPRVEEAIRSAIAEGRGEAHRRSVQRWVPRKSLRQRILDSYDRDAPSLPLGGF